MINGNPKGLAVVGIDLFEDNPDRTGRNSLKWGKYEGKDVLPLWVADMDFRSPPEVIRVATEVAEFGNYGYGTCPDTLVESVCERSKSLYGWDVEKHWLVWLPGMVCALNVCCRAFEDSSQAITQVPIYPPFLSAPSNFGLSCTQVPMILSSDRYTIDFNALNELNTLPNDLFMLCHPHNPVGTAYRQAELESLAQWILERELVLCSDEIHCDLLLEPNSRHHPMASLGPEIAGRTITLMAPSKTFNLPGFGCSFAIISNGELRRKFKRAMAGIVPDPPAMSFPLTESAFRSGEKWRLQLLDYLRGNRELALSRLRDINGLIPYSPEATYLLWMDARKLPVPNPHQFFEEHGVGLSDGRDFGSPGFLRMNLGCASSLLEEALGRMNKACQSLT